MFFGEKVGFVWKNCNRSSTVQFHDGMQEDTDIPQVNQPPWSKILWLEY